MTHATRVIEEILAHMEPEGYYQSAELKESLGYTKDQIRTALTALKHKRLVTKNYHIGKGCLWQKTELACRAPEAPVQTSIATPQIAPDLTATMKGYWSEIESRVALAMSIKRSI